jgi:hypothetical protein
VNEEETFWLQVALVYQNVARLAKSLEIGEAEEMSDERRAAILTTAKSAESARDVLATEPGHGTLEELFPSPPESGEGRPPSTPEL